MAKRCFSVLILACGAACGLWVAGAPVGDALQAAESAPADPLDWPFWRGPAYDGVSRETGLVDDFDPGGGPGSNVAWKRAELGSRSTPVVMNGRLYTLARAEPGTPREGEKVVCADAATGETLWENRFNVWLSDVPKERVGWSSVVADPETGNVYALGVCGFFQCLNGETGERLWSCPLHEQFGLLSTYGGRTNFPLICDDLVIVNGVTINWGEKAKPAHRFLAFDKRSGELIWYEGTEIGPEDTTYSAPALAVLDGQRALVFGSGDGQVWAFQPRTGRPLWHYAFSRRGLNVAPVVEGDTVYMGHSEENLDTTAMGCVAAIRGGQRGDITRGGALWRVEELMVGKSSPVLVDGRLYCVEDSAKLYVLDAQTGEIIGRGQSIGTAMRASLLYADGKLYAFEQNGRWWIVAPDERRGFKILNRGRLPAGEECHASPICSHGRVYVQTTGGLYCLVDENKQAGSTPRPAAPREQPVAQDPAPAQLQLVPAELLLRPGQQQSFRGRLFNSHGQLLRETPVAFRLEGPGSITADGQFTADPAAAHEATTVHAQVGELEATARIRTVPDLPWEFDFEQLSDPPVTWVGARYRHVLRAMEGGTVMVKVNTLPKGTRSRCWFGRSDLHDYTIQADVRGTIQDNKMPDIGLIAQGYAMDMQGESQKLQIRSWVSELRMATTINFAWQPDTWYVMKLQASLQDGQARLRGKVWPRGQDEPDAWTLEAVDPSPNLSGSPGLYGNAKDAEIYLDNIRVFAP